VIINGRNKDDEASEKIRELMNDYEMTVSTTFPLPHRQK